MSAVVLAAGFGERLRPITDLVPKALCPVGNKALLDHAVDRAAAHAGRVAVNVHAHEKLMLEHLDGRDVHVSVEQPRPLGTAGAIGQLRSWIGDTGCLVMNADAYSTDALNALVSDWNGETVRLLVTYEPKQADFGGVWRFAGASLLPNRWVRRLQAEPSGLYEACWRFEMAVGAAQLVPTRSVFVDCGTPGDLLAANLIANLGKSAVAPSAAVNGEVIESLVMPGAAVRASEHLFRAIRLQSGETLLPWPTSRAE